MDNAQEVAELLALAGWRVVPVFGKAPRAKKWLRDWTDEEIAAEFARGADGVGLILDGLIDFDEDGPGAGDEYAALGLPETVSWASHKGRHHVFSLSPAQRTELAAAGREKLNLGDLEVRWSPRLQSVIPPSGGRTWIRSLLDQDPAPLPTLDWLFARLPKQPDVASHPAEVGDGPGHIFNREAEWAEILEPHGYSLVRERKENGHHVQDWLRPGDTDQRLSLTTGYCRSTCDDDKLFCFSTSCEPLPVGQALSKFAAYALLEHDGDYTEAARDLASKGYVKHIDVEIFADDEDAPRQDFARVPVIPGLVEDIAEWHCRRAQVADRQAGRVAGIMACSWLLGRRARFGFDGTRANLLAMLSGRPGSGKSEILHSLSVLLGEVGFSDELVSSFASGQAVENALHETPRLLLLKDEAQDLVLDALDSHHARSALPSLKEMYSKSRSAHSMRKKATEKTGAPIIQPYLTSLLLVTGSTVWDRLPEYFYRDGLVARMLLFALPEHTEENERVEELSAPASFVQAVQEWSAGELFPDEPEGEEEEGDKRDGVQELPPQLFDISCDNAAAVKLRQLKRLWRQPREDDVLMDFYVRGQELTCKLCMIASASQGRAVDAGTVEEMAGFVEAMIQDKILCWQSRQVDGRDYEAVTRKVVRSIETYDKGKGAYLSRMRARLKGLDVDTVNRALYGLYLAGKIRVSKEDKINSAHSFSAVKKVSLRPLADDKEAD